jgi:hypothetical protein
MTFELLPEQRRSITPITCCRAAACCNGSPVITGSLSAAVAVLQVLFETFELLLQLIAVLLEVLASLRLRVETAETMTSATAAASGMTRAAA